MIFLWDMQGDKKAIYSHRTSLILSTVYLPVNAFDETFLLKSGRFLVQLSVPTHKNVNRKSSDVSLNVSVTVRSDKWKFNNFRAAILKCGFAPSCFRWCPSTFEKGLISFNIKVVSNCSPFMVSNELEWVRHWGTEHVGDFCHFITPYCFSAK